MGSSEGIRLDRRAARRHKGSSTSVVMAANVIWTIVSVIVPIASLLSAVVLYGFLFRRNSDPSLLKDFIVLFLGGAAGFSLSNLIKRLIRSVPWIENNRSKVIDPDDMGPIFRRSMPVDRSKLNSATRDAYLDIEESVSMIEYMSDMPITREGSSVWYDRMQSLIDDIDVAYFRSDLSAIETAQEANSTMMKELYDWANAIADPNK